jgi:hypothetical protein
MKIKTLLIISILTLLGCNENVDQRKEQIKEFKIDLNTKEVSDNNYEVNIKTNFPENTSFQIYVTRDYRRTNSSEQYSGKHYSVFSNIVKNGEINFNFEVDDSKWINDYQKYQKENGSFDKTLTDIDFETVKDSIEIYVLYTPKGEKNKENIKLIGKNGENLKGNNVEENGTFKVFSKTIKFYNKFLHN